MRASSALFAAVLLAGLLAACATSRDTIVLLPRDDGSTGAIAASRAGEQVLLDSAYASATPGAGGKLQRGTADRATLEKKFGAALAAMPAAAKSFIVYFLSGSDDFSEESKSVVSQMLEGMRERAVPEVTVIGHTDMVGSDQDNDALSLQRAERVKQMLVELGVPAGQISTAGRGAREPLVVTERGVDEPQNRRVEVNVR